MTREEAKKELSKMIFELGFEDNVDDKVYALNMAIKALSQEPCEDAEHINYYDDFVTALKKISDYKRINDMTDEEVYKRFVEPYHKFNKSEPCEDAVSRQAVLQAVSEGCFELRGVYGRCEELINALPSVTQKSGKWERHYIRPNVYKDLLWYCSSCGKGCGYNNAFMFDFCPNCGAKMAESEDKE